MTAPGRPQTSAELSARGATPGDKRSPGGTLALPSESPANRILGGPGYLNPRTAMNVLTIAATYDGRRRGEPEAVALARALRGVLYQEARAAVVEHYRRSRFPVTPADFLDLVEEYRDALPEGVEFHEATQQEAEAAWERIER